MNGIEFLETLGFEMQGEPIGTEEIDGIYKLGGRYEPGPTPKDGVVDGKSLSIKQGFFFFTHITFFSQISRKSHAHNVL
jgi:hypothetical protein